MQTTTNSGSSTFSAPTKDAMKDYASSSNPHLASDARLSDVASKAASDVATKAAQSVRGLVDESRAAATQRIDATTKWVGEATRDNPLRSLGIVAAIGVVIGLLIGRR